MHFNSFNAIVLLVIFLILSSCLPDPLPYPHKPAQDVVSEAQVISDNLESYIEGWLDGQNPAQIPDSLIPDGVVDNEDFYLKHPDSVSASETWGWRVAEPVDFDSLHNGIPDPNATYLLLGPALAPFGSKVHIEGEFPYCRFFSIQMSPPLSGEEYTYNRYFGPTEVSIVDADIDPLPGHTNPFRVGNYRKATNRSYQVTYELTTGNPVSVSNNQFQPPYRYPGNLRKGSFIQYQGPWGEDGGFDGIMPANGEWNIGALWVRIYAPDSGKGPFGGVNLPKVYYELPDGREYFIGANFDKLVERANGTMAARSTNTQPNAYIDASDGWLKSFGILRNILVGSAQANDWTHPDSLEKIRKVDLGVTGRGLSQGAPANYEPSATGNNYVNYFGRYQHNADDYVTVLTGKLPTFPNTRPGLDTMTAAQIRYWSVVGYDNSIDAQLPGSAVNAIMDDEVVLDENRNYIICYAQSNDRPINATAENGVTWKNWGPTMDLGLVIRYLSVNGDWSFSKTPDELNLNWEENDFASTQFDSSHTYQNWHNCWMECYQPRIHYMHKQEFEALGNDFKVQDIPIWVHDKFELGLSDAVNQPIFASSVQDTAGEYNVEYANDRDINSRWCSVNHSGTQQENITIDLGNIKRISAVKISWEFLAHAAEYEIQTSDDGNSWTTIHEELNGSGGNEVIDHLNAYGRYVRIEMNTSVLFSYCIHNFEVYTPSKSCLDFSIPVDTTAHNDSTATAIDLAKEFKINTYPSPTYGLVNIHSENGDWDNVRIFNSNGQFVKTLPYSNQIKIDGAPGVYILIFNKDGNYHSKKIIKL